MIVAKEFETIDDKAETDVKVSLAFVDNIWVRQMEFNNGASNTPHYHSHDHLSLLAHGSVECDVDGNKTIFHAPAMILITKDQLHKFTALSDDVVIYCVHGMRDKNTGDLIDSNMIPKGSSAADATNHIELMGFKGNK